MPSLLSQRERAHCTALEDGSLFVYGGLSRNGWNDSVELLSPHADHWVTVPNLERVTSVVEGPGGGVYFVQANEVTFAPEPLKAAWTVRVPQNFELTRGAFDPARRMILGRAGAGTGAVLELAPGADTWTEHKKFSIPTSSNMLGAVRVKPGFLVLNSGRLEHWSLSTGAVDFVSRLDGAAELLALDEGKAAIFSHAGSLTLYDPATRALKRLAALDGEGGAFIADAENGYWIGGTRKFLPPSARRDGALWFGLSLVGIISAVVMSRRFGVPRKQIWALALGTLAGALLHLLLSAVARGSVG